MGERLTLLVIIAFLVVSVHASAHRPLFVEAEAARPEGALRVKNPTVSHVLYIQLTDEAPQKWFVFDVEAPREVEMKVGLPTAVGQGDFRPQVALFGPGWPELTDGAPVEPPQPGLGGVLLPVEESGRRFYEAVTGTESLIVADTRVDLPTAGTYYGVVFSRQGHVGKAWISIGQSEGFSWRDITKLPGWIADVRRFHEVPGWPRWAWIGALSLLAVVAGLGVRLRRK